LAIEKSFSVMPPSSCGERQCHLIETNVYIRVVIHFLGFSGNPIDKINALQKPLKLKRAKNRLRAFRPVRDGLQVQLDLFGM
jgi:hypothetical protein